MRLRYVIEAVGQQCWAMQPEKLHAILEVLSLHAGNARPQFEAAAAPRAIGTTGGVAVLPIYGMLSQRMNMMADMSGGTSTDLLGAQFDAAMADPAIKGIVFDVDSPGGAVQGTMELAAKIAAARGGKRIVAIANSLSASAAYWLSTAADEVFATPTAEVGSVGIIAAHLDSTAALEQAGLKYTLITAGRFKGETLDKVPLTDEARAFLQGRVNSYYDMFTNAIAANRGVSPDAVVDGFGEGRAVGANEALKLGMIDRIGTLPDAIARAGQRRRAPSADRERTLALLQRTA